MFVSELVGFKWNLPALGCPHLNCSSFISGYNHVEVGRNVTATNRAVAAETIYQWVTRGYVPNANMPIFSTYKALSMRTISLHFLAHLQPSKTNIFLVILTSNKEVPIVGPNS